MILRDGLHLRERIGAQQVHERGWYSQHLYDHAATKQQDEAHYTTHRVVRRTKDAGVFLIHNFTIPGQ